MGNSISVAESTAHLITHKTTETEQQQTQNEVVIPVIEVPVPKSEVILITRKKMIWRVVNLKIVYNFI